MPEPIIKKTEVLDTTKAVVAGPPPAAKQARKEPDDIIDETDEADGVEEQPTEDFVQVENTSARIHGIGHMQPKGARGVHVGVSFNLVPGINKVPRSLWEEAKSHRMVALHLNEGTFVEGKNKPLSREVEGKAVNIVKKTFTMKLLREFARQDKRARVVKAIQDQMKLLTDTDPNQAENGGVTIE